MALSNSTDEITLRNFLPVNPSDKPHLSPDRLGFVPDKHRRADTSIIADLMRSHQPLVDYWAGYGSVPAIKIVPPSRPAPRGRTRKTTSCPLLSEASMRLNSSSLLTGSLLICRMISPRLSPVSSANEPGFTS